MDLVEYLFVDQKRLEMYAEQMLDILPRGTSTTISGTVGLSSTGPSLNLERKVAERAPSVHEKIVGLRQMLTESGNLGTKRPPRLLERGRALETPFILETTIARKVILPRSLLSGLPSLNELAVWVADPDPTDFTTVNESWDCSEGTFLLLTELHLDDVKFHTTYSGCSALQAVVNVATGKPFLSTAEYEPLGRWNKAHPVEKLVDLGAHAGDSRRIETLYRVRYMTDEQCYVVDGGERRVYDLLGYPVYIADAGFGVLQANHGLQPTAAAMNWIRRWWRRRG